MTKYKIIMGMNFDRDLALNELHALIERHVRVGWEVVGSHQHQMVRCGMDREYKHFLSMTMKISEELYKQEQQEQQRQLQHQFQQQRQRLQRQQEQQHQQQRVSVAAVETSVSSRSGKSCTSSNSSKSCELQ